MAAISFVERRPSTMPTFLADRITNGLFQTFKEELDLLDRREGPKQGSRRGAKAPRISENRDRVSDGSHRPSIVRRTLEGRESRSLREPPTYLRALLRI